MGKLLDMLPQIEAGARTRDILEGIGCIGLRCTVVAHEDVARLGRWVRHNDETKFFEHIIEREATPVFRQRGDWRHRLTPIAYVRSDIAVWIAEQHLGRAAQQEEQRQAEIDADGWRQHAAMVAGD